VLVLLGRSPEPDPMMGIERKSTVDGVSTYTTDAYGDDEALLRLCRLGNEVRIYSQAIDGDAWTFHASFSRPDLGAELEVGLTAYSQTDPPALTAYFDWVDFAPVDAPDDCEAAVTP
jgi:hypothetical protein